MLVEVPGCDDWDSCWKPAKRAHSFDPIAYLHILLSRHKQCKMCGDCFWSHVEPVGMSSILDFEVVQGFPSFLDTELDHLQVQALWKAIAYTQQVTSKEIEATEPRHQDGSDRSEAGGAQGLACVWWGPTPSGFQVSLLCDQIDLPASFLFLQAERKGPSGRPCFQGQRLKLRKLVVRSRSNFDKGYSLRSSKSP